MIIMRFTSGLGNQMFQYSFYQMLKEKFPDTTVKADITWFHAYNEHQGFELERIFRHDGNQTFHMDIASYWDLFKVTGLIPCFVKGKWASRFEKILYYPNRLLRLFTENHYKKTKISQTGIEDNESIMACIDKIDVSKDWYITGFFIEEAYYRQRMPILWKHFVFREPEDTCNSNLLKQIRNSNSVSIHVRHGDYTAPQYAGRFLLLDMDYYQRAVAYIKERVEHPVFYIFSDDKEYIEQAFEWLEDKVLVSNNKGADSYIDMQLMSNCRHNITANSTFSIWGGLLNKNPDCLVVYPAKYIYEKDSEIKTIPGWYRI